MGDKSFYETFLMIHESVGATHDKELSSSTPRRYISFLEMYRKIYEGKRDKILERQKHLSGGLNKLNEAKKNVDTLKKAAEKQSVILKEKQEKANTAMVEIKANMENASDRKKEMETTK